MYWACAVVTQTRAIIPIHTLQNLTQLAWPFFIPLPTPSGGSFGRLLSPNSASLKPQIRRKVQTISSGLFPPVVGKGSINSIVVFLWSLSLSRCGYGVAVREAPRQPPSLHPNAV